VSTWKDENERNARNSALYDAIIRTVFEGVTQFAAGHHLMFQTADGVNEYPSADTLIFDHDVAKKVFGEEHYINALERLAGEPVETRDNLLFKLFYEGAHK
jgi:hypothetical protein